MSSKIVIEVDAWHFQYDPNYRWSYSIFVDDEVVLICPHGMGQGYGWQKDCLKWLHENNFIRDYDGISSSFSSYGIKVVYK